MNKKYNKFLDLLGTFEKKGCVEKLHRGISKEFAFKSLNLDLKHNSIEQFAERLFFFGEKAKYFWNEKLRNSEQEFDFEINDISNKFFKYIFNEFNNLIVNGKKPRTKQYFAKNKKPTSFFSETGNIDKFVEKIELLTESEQLQTRNDYLKILHQLGESDYKKSSQFLSGSEETKIAQGFSKGGITINFWEINSDKSKINFDIPLFVGKPYEKQKETTIFAVILPHYIYSFTDTDENLTYPNPAIKTTKNFEPAIFSGLEIQQNNFLEKLKMKTGYKSGIVTDGKKYNELK